MRSELFLFIILIGLLPFKLVNILIIYQALKINKFLKHRPANQLTAGYLPSLKLGKAKVSGKRKKRGKCKVVTNKKKKKNVNNININTYYRFINYHAYGE